MERITGTTAHIAPAKPEPIYGPHDGNWSNTCKGCDHTWHTNGTDTPGTCPDCGSHNITSKGGQLPVVGELSRWTIHTTGGPLVGMIFERAGGTFDWELWAHGEATAAAFAEVGEAIPRIYDLGAEAGEGDEEIPPLAGTAATVEDAAREAVRVSRRIAGSRFFPEGGNVRGHNVAHDGDGNPVTERSEQSYTVHLSQEHAEWITGDPGRDSFAGDSPVGKHLGDGTVRLTGLEVDALHERGYEADGFCDDAGMWIGGDPYPLVAESFDASNLLGAPAPQPTGTRAYVRCIVATADPAAPETHALLCQRAMNHQGPHQHADAGRSLEWDDETIDVPADNATLRK